MNKRFKTKKDFEHFCDTSMWCVCGKLMTGFHMSGCQKLRKIERQFMVTKEPEKEVKDKGNIEAWKEREAEENERRKGFNR